MGVIAAMNDWMVLDGDAIRDIEREALEEWRDAITGLPGITLRMVPDPTNNPLDRFDCELSELGQRDFVNKRATG